MKVESEKDFIEVKITPEMIEEAEERNKTKKAIYGTLKTRRTKSTRARMTGFIGEVAAKKVFQKLSYSDENDVDLVSKDNKITFDVKSNGGNTNPQLTHCATIYEKNYPCGVYIFAKVLNDFSKLWITGFIPKQELVEKVKLVPKGTVRIGYVCEDDRYELEYSHLYKPSLLL